MSTSASEATASAACPHLQRFHLTPPAERPLDEPDYFAELRETCPVSRVELPSGKQAWLFTAYDDVRAVLSDPRFSSEAGRPNFPFDGQPGGDDPIAVGSLIRQDPPLHTALRRTPSWTSLGNQVFATAWS